MYPHGAFAVVRQQRAGHLDYLPVQALQRDHPGHYCVAANHVQRAAAEVEVLEAEPELHQGRGEEAAEEGGHVGDSGVGEGELRRLYVLFNHRKRLDYNVVVDVGAGRGVPVRGVPELGEAATGHQTAALPALSGSLPAFGFFLSIGRDCWWRRGLLQSGTTYEGAVHADDAAYRAVAQLPGMLDHRFGSLRRYGAASRLQVSFELGTRVLWV
ncbi:polyketide cyclase / dehydrase and lipid transport [Babesia caballi]|uniref:Polyketide cyclase / dehydrase and lipid transport n=1 Tax=Babesia caballi TaxID=5871 RepID=A0AAV4LTH3_BABCB|nr:polyketide cyclase / dehydrase and lipid transport [Babesia caballi]